MAQSDKVHYRLIVLFVIFVLLAGVLAYFLFLQKNTPAPIQQNPPPLQTPQTNSVITPTIPFKEEYQNPFEKKEEYTNPFENTQNTQNSQNPFDNLQ